MPQQKWIERRWYCFTERALITRAHVDTEFSDQKFREISNDLAKAEDDEKEQVGERLWWTLCTQHSQHVVLLA